MEPSRHIRFGWWSLLFFLTFGLFLEGLLGFRLGWYLDVGKEARRLMFTLAHAHGALLALVNIAAGLTLRSFAITFPRGASISLILAAILLPLGFLLGGIVIYDGDPGLGVLLTPIGALFLFYGVGRLALALSKMP